jgi:hypothetical protein
MRPERCVFLNEVWRGEELMEETSGYIWWLVSQFYPILSTYDILATFRSLPVSSFFDLFPCFLHIAASSRSHEDEPGMIEWEIFIQDRVWPYEFT